MAKKPYLADTSQDDGIRPSKGIVATLIEAEDGQSKIVFDDVAATPDTEKTWKHNVLYTWHVFDDSSLNEMKLTDKQYQDIGVALVARLLALSGRVR